MFKGEKMKDKYCSHCGYKLTNNHCELMLDDENLKVTHYRNGDPIPLAVSNEQWIEFGGKGIGTYSIKDGEYYYNWYAVNDNRGLAPEGWRVPTNNELDKLKKELEKTGLPSGYRYGSNGNYYYIGDVGYFWSSSEYASNYAWGRVLGCDGTSVYRFSHDKQNGFSVRCVKEKK